MEDWRGEWSGYVGELWERKRRALRARLGSVWGGECVYVGVWGVVVGSIGYFLFILVMLFSGVYGAI